jgi:membrane protein
MRAVSTGKTAVGRAQASLPWRAWQRYGQARGSVLAGGMAYIAFFSLFPALALGFTVFGLVVGNDAELQGRVVDAVNNGLGTTIITPIGRTSGGLISFDTLTGSTELTVAGVIGLLGFLIAGLSWLDAMREGVRAMFGQPTFEGNIVKTKLLDLVTLVTLGLVLLASALGGVLVSGAAGRLLRLVGLDGSTLGSIVLGAISTLVLLAVDIAVFLIIFELLSGVSVPRNDLGDAALFGGVGLGILKLLGGLLLHGAGNNKLVATAGVALGLLIWLNLVSRLTLVAAAWGATVAIDRGHLAAEEHGLPQATSVPEPRTSRDDGEPARPSPVAPRPAFTPVVSPRNADRVSVAAGAVLGAAGLVAARTAAGAVRSIWSAARRDD